MDLGLGGKAEMVLPRCCGAKARGWRSAPGAPTIGISALIAASVLAFTVLKWIGAAYLVYLGIQMLRASFRDETAFKTTSQPMPSDSLRQIFLQGVLTNVLNPKVAVFFLAFLPQFVDVDAPAKVAGLIALGLLFNAVGTMWNIAVAWFAGRIATTKVYASLRAWLERTMGALFVYVGIKLALADRP